MREDIDILFIVMYHYTRDLRHSRYPEIKGLDSELFRQQLDYFKHNFNVVRMEQVIESVKGAKKLPEKAVLLTFDDGYIDNYTFAFPLLEEFGFQGSFFIPGKTFSTHRLLDVNKIHYMLASADIHKLLIDVNERIDYYRGGECNIPSKDELWDKWAVENRFDDIETVYVKRMLQTALPEKLRNIISSDLFKKYVGVSEEQLAYEIYMTPEQLRTMKRHGMFIGLHGYDHYWLGNLAEQDEKLMKDDVDQALYTLDEFIDKNAWVMNYPYGNYSDSVIRYIQDKGAVLGLTTEVGVAEIGLDNRFTLPRFDCNDFPPKSWRYRQ